MKQSVQFSKLAILALAGGLAVATSGQAAQAAGAFSSYDPAHAYTGDPAFAQSRAEYRAPARQRGIERGVSASKTHNLPYADRPYGDPDVP